MVPLSEKEEIEVAVFLPFGGWYSNKASTNNFSNVIIPVECVDRRDSVLEPCGNGGRFEKELERPRGKEEGRDCSFNVVMTV